jgi:polyphenol oxidase
MLQIKTNKIDLYNFDNLIDNKNICHFITSRSGGVSKKPYHSLNLSYSTKDLAENILENRARIARMLRIENEKLIFPTQTHSTNIKIIEENFLSLSASDKEKQLCDVDALVTKEKGICICALTADCVPVFLFDREKHVVSVVHAGWRGTAGEIVSKTIMLLQDKFQTNPEHILAGIGPSIGTDAYEVGNEIAGIFIKLYGKDSNVVISRKFGDKVFLNLWEANRLQLIQSGVPEKNIEVAGMCTYQHDDIFYSSRKSGGDTGRFGNGIMLL